jgi:aminomethyltransferase
VARSGYTGSGGYELFASLEVIPLLWEQLLVVGKDHGLEPVGLGARDTLRLEAGYALYGHELTDTIAPTESVSAWTVKWKKGYFVAQEALLHLEGNPDKRSQHGVVLDEPGVPRANCRVFCQRDEAGVVTSGSHSPCLNCGIAIVMVKGDLALGEAVEIEIRGRKLKGHVIKLPFYKV